MPWANFDDAFPRHGKVKRLSDSAFRLHVQGIIFCAEHLTDGAIREDELEDVGVRMRGKKLRRAVDELMAGSDPLWEATDTGWHIHDYLDWQRSRAQILRERKLKAARQARWSEKKRRATDAYVDGLEDGAEDAYLDASRDASEDATLDASPSQAKPISTKRTTSADADGDPDFVTFWDTWPRKIAKPAARKAWRAARKKTDAATIIDGAQDFADRARRAGTEPKFMPHAATWLNNERWTDDDTTTAPPPFRRPAADERCPVDGHVGQRAGACRICRSEAISARRAR